METCSPPHGCRVRYSAETAEELSAVLANSYAHYLRASDPKLKETLYKSRMHVNRVRRTRYEEIKAEACFECPFRF